MTHPWTEFYVRILNQFDSKQIEAKEAEKEFMITDMPERIRSRGLDYIRKGRKTAVA